MNPHLEEWKKIKKDYEESLCDFLHINYDAVKFRIECIDELLNQEKEKEMNHFR